MNFRQFFQKKSLTKPTILIKVARCSSPEYWYREAVGKMFVVEAQPFQDFYIIYSEDLAAIAFIKVEDCEVVEQPE